MVTWFDESRLDDEVALATADRLLRPVAEAGSRVRRESDAVAEARDGAIRRTNDGPRPRALLAAGPDSRLLRAVLEQTCPVPFVAWPHPTMPGWAGGLDLVVMLAPSGTDRGACAAVAQAVRRGCQVVVACPPHSPVAEHAAGRDTTVLPTVTGDQLATAVTVLDFLSQVSLGPRAEPEGVAAALDEVAVACSPHRDLAVNPAKMMAISLADSVPVVWGGSVLAARAARRVAESLRRASGRSALAGDLDQLLPLLESAPRRNVFDDPFADTGDGPALHHVLLVLDDGTEDPMVREQRDRLTEVAGERGIRVEALRAEEGSQVARYAALLAQGTWTSEYLRLGLVED